MAESNVAQDQIKAFVDRILRMKEEAKAINADVRGIYAEAKGAGFDKTVLGKLVSYIEKRQADANAVLESESVFDLYLTAYDSAIGKVGTKRATHTHASEKADPIAALRADPALAIIEPAILESKLQKVQTAQTESQPTPKAGSDLTVPPSPQGQVVDIQPETADEKPETSEFASTDPQRSVVATREDANAEASGADAGSSNGRTAAFDAVNAGSTPAPATTYAAPGVVVWESTPPEGVVRHPYSAAFGDLGQDIHVIADDIAGAKAEPIVKIGLVILDGWARYMTARGAFGLDGQPTEYQVVQYDGTDPLIDCIRWNVGGRILSNTQKQTVVNRLCAIEPKRKAEIIKAVAEMAI